MRQIIIRLCDFLIDRIAGTKPDTRLTAFLGGIANRLETQEYILFNNVSAKKILFLVVLCLMALA